MTDPIYGLPAASDPLGLADTGIILAEAPEILEQELVEMNDQEALALGSATVERDGIYVCTCVYLLADALVSLELPFGSDLGDYRAQNANVNCDGRGAPRVTVTAIKPKTGSFATVAGDKTATLTIAGGVGAVALFGATCADPISSSLSISGQRAIASVGGNILTKGLAVFGWKGQATLESYSSSTPPVGSKKSTEGSRPSSEGFTIYTRSWAHYLTFA